MQALNIQLESPVPTKATHGSAGKAHAAQAGSSFVRMLESFDSASAASRPADAQRAMDGTNSTPHGKRAPEAVREKTETGPRTKPARLRKADPASPEAQVLQTASADTEALVADKVQQKLPQPGEEIFASARQDSGGTDVSELFSKDIPVSELSGPTLLAAHNRERLAAKDGALFSGETSPSLSLPDFASFERYALDDSEQVLPSAEAVDQNTLSQLISNAPQVAEDPSLPNKATSHTSIDRDGEQLLADFAAVHGAEGDGQSGSERTFIAEITDAGQSPLFTVRDERSARQFNEQSHEKTDGSPFTKATLKNESTLDVTVNLAQNVNQNVLSSNDQSAAATGSTFQHMLSEQIQQNAGDFVKAGSIVLRDNNEGTINMVLKPESLGNVKVTLQLSDKGITGHIVVASREAMEAFRHNIETLRTAFQQNGFENANFELSLSSGGNPGSFDGQKHEQQAQQFLGSQAYNGVAASTDGADTPLVPQSFAAAGDNQVDVVA